MTGRPTYEQLRERWEKVCGKKIRLAEKAIYRKAKKRPSGPEIIAELKDYYVASGGDRRFAEAVSAIEEHGFDRAHAGTWKRVEAKVFGKDRIYLARMKQLIEGGASDRHAAARVAEQYSVLGKTFNAAVDHLRNIWRREIKRAEELEKRPSPPNK